MQATSQLLLPGGMTRVALPYPLCEIRTCASVTQPPNSWMRRRRILKIDEALAEDEKILECLGAAVVMRWATLPSKIQRELFEYATSLADFSRIAPLKVEIARFLHNHKDDGGRTTKTMSSRVAVIASALRLSYCTCADIVPQPK